MYWLAKFVKIELKITANFDKTGNIRLSIDYALQLESRLCSFPKETQGQ